MLNWSRACIITLIWWTLVPTATVAQYGGRGPVRRREVPIEAFSELSVYAAFNVYFTPAVKPSLTLEATEELLALIEVSQQGERLLITVKGDVRMLSRFNLFVEGPTPSGIELVGDGAFAATGPLECDSLNIFCQGSVGLEAELKVRQLDLLWSGTGRWHIAGKAMTAHLRLSGATDLDAQNLGGTKLALRALGAGTVQLGRFDEVEAVVAGQVNFSVKGEPRQYHVVRPSTARPDAPNP